jgi:glycosyltransferase involved in cell wall biosynthesis
MKISIIVPCYNEEKTIKAIITKIINLKDLNKEIIVIDDQSTDNSRKILKEELSDLIDCLILNNKNCGKGFSIREGIKAATGDIILIQDADLEYDPSDYNKLISPIKNGYADVVYGSRFTGSDEKRVLLYWHTVGNFILTQLSNMFTNLNLTDMENCYKTFRSDVLKSITLKENRFGFEPEVTAKISKIKNIRIYEVGVKYYGRSYDEGKKINWKDGISAIRCIFYYNLFSKN